MSYVSPAYFANADPFSDFVVHEAPHIFHNCKRHTVGLAETRTREWLLEIKYQKRETFAYACEACARILERAPKLRDRPAQAREFGTKIRVSDERVDPAEIGDILAAACVARNGWKVILGKCSPES